jgi:hypothetical protein
MEKTMPEKKFHLPAENIKRLVGHDGGCIATDTITVDGRPVGYMYRDRPRHEADTGWRFMAGDESDDYMDDADKHGAYAVNTIANYDRDILPLIDAPVGSAFARNPETGRFEPVSSPVNPDDCLHPDFPIVTGHYQLNSTWAIDLPLKFSRRVEGGSLILWRPGVTLYFSALTKDDGESTETRLAQLKGITSPDAFEPREEQTRTGRQFSYRLVEGGVNALYGFVITGNGHLQVAFYFDNEPDIELARKMFASITEGAA